jgi:predicted secreted protein
MLSAMSFIPFLFFIVWLGVVVYVLLLGTRLVNAVEQIARAMTQHLPDAPKP